jgi:hypothetical protein
MPGDLQMRMAAAIVLCVLAGLTLTGRQVAAQQMQEYYHPINLDPAGDNWLALKDEPNINSRRIMKMGPDTLFTVIGRSGPWLKVQLRSGQVGWAHSSYVGCCRVAPKY